jgi:hypothetical protein
MPSCLVVGDAYAKLSDDESVVVASALRRRLALEERWPSDRHFVMGQGMNREDVDALRTLVRSRGLEEQFSFSDERAPLPLTHKCHDDHVLITRPTCVEPHHYRFGLAIDDRVDRLSDHVTGVHIGGMVLLEAGRQAIVTVLETEYRNEGDKPLGLVWNSLSIRFLNFAFPVPTTISVRVSPEAQNRSDSARGQRGSTALSVDFRQADALVCQFEVAVGNYDSDALAKIERRRARRAVDSALAQLKGEPVKDSEVA